MRKVIDTIEVSNQNKFDDKSDWKALGMNLHFISDADCYSHKVFQSLDKFVPFILIPQILGDFDTNSKEYENALNAVETVLQKAVDLKTDEIQAEYRNSHPEYK